MTKNYQDSCDGRDIGWQPEEKCKEDKTESDSSYDLEEYKPELNIKPECKIDKSDVEYYKDDPSGKQEFPGFGRIIAFSEGEVRRCTRKEDE